MSRAKAKPASITARGLRTHAELGAQRPHGERMRYMAGCRCDACRAANSRYESERSRARQSGDWNGIVPAAAARAHILRLRRCNVGRRAIAAATDIGETIVHEIATGKRRRIRARTERRILAVSSVARFDRSLVSAGRTWQLVRELLHEEYTEAFLAQRLGFATARLQFGRERVTARTAYRVERLHRELTT